MNRLKLKYFKILAAFLLVLLVCAWINSTRQLMALEQRTRPTALIPVSMKKASAHHTQKSAPALTVSVFGDYVPDDMSTSGVRRSSLNIKVVGILFDQDETQSHVMLELPSHEVKSFGVGDVLPGGAVIKRITPEGVFLMHEGVLESLSLPKNELFFSPPAKMLQQDD